ncbi:hypothetical protein BsWGS_10924 [Bradybaena similaris]
MGNSCRRGTRRNDSLGYLWNSNASFDLKTAPFEHDMVLTREEIRVLKQQWKSITANVTIRVFAYTLFERLFVVFPDTAKLLYVPETGDCISSQQWKEHPSFALHVREVVTALGTIVRLLDQPLKLKEFIISLEEFHRSLRGMKKYYVEEFIYIIDDTMAFNFGSQYTGDMKRAFRKVLTILYFKMTYKLLV